MDFMECSESRKEILRLHRRSGYFECPVVLMLCSCLFVLNFFNCTHHGFIDWHDAPTTPFVHGLLGDLRDRVWKLESYAAEVECTDEPKEEKEQKAVVVTDKTVRKEMLFLFATVIFLFGIIVGMMLG